MIQYLQNIINNCLPIKKYTQVKEISNFMFGVIEKNMIKCSIQKITIKNTYMRGNFSTREFIQIDITKLR